MTSNGDDHLNDLAVIGMDARLPGAPDLRAFWDNLRRGVESVAIAYETPPVVQGGLAHVRASACVEGMELFDAGFFGFNPREAEVMDPQIRLFLECAWTALESAGYDARQFAGRIGVFAGAASSSYLTANLLRNTELFRSGGGVSSLGVFNNCDALATIASYKFDLTGPSVTVQTFCSTSLVAVHLACQSLLSGESDLALAGASTLNVQADKGYLYQEGGILSADGHTRSFDARAKGTMFGNGVGVVVLKRLVDAQADGDVIHAVVRGSAVNNDGARKAGYTAPSVIGQSKAVAEALAVARVNPETIGYVEAHGTATALGDPIEVEALTRAFRARTSRRGYCAIGSVKSNFGHLDRTAGLAALLKTVLMLKHREIPPSLNFESPNPEIDFESSPFRVATELTEWRTSGGPLRAGISALGVGGTNAHVIVEEAPARRPSGPSRASQLLVLSARSDAALDAATERLATHLESAPDQGLGDVAYTLMVGRRRFEHRRTVVADDAASAATALRSRDRQRSFTATSSATDRPVVFMFPGQGAQYVGMTRGVYETETPYREALDACCERLEPLLGLDLRAQLFAPREREDEAAERLRQTALTQPALFAVEYALARLWKSWGVEPSAMIGHSIGEYVAAHLAGVFSLDDALRLVVERGRLMQTMPEGAMLAVPLPAEEVEPLLGEALALAAVNAPSLCVVSGPSREVDSLEARLAERETTGMRLHTSHAFHSPMMDPILAAFRARVEATTLAAPTLPVVSNRTGGWLTAAQATDPGYWVDHLRHTVRFAEGMRILLDEHERIFLEVGPGTALSGLARLNAPVDEVPALVTCVRHPKDPQGDQAFVLGALGRLWAAGAPIDSAAVFAGEERHRVELPTYPFERRRYWIDPPTEGASASSTSGRKDPSRWFYLPVWKTALPPPALPTGNGERPSGAWLILANDDPLSSRVVSRLREQGEEVFVARPGLRFSGGPSKGFTLRATAPDDYDSLLEALGESGGRVSRVVHALCLDSSSHGGPVTDEGLSRGQGRGFYSLLFLTQAMGKLGWGQPLQLRVLTSGAHAVLSGEVLEPEKAPMLGLARVIPQEQHNVRCLALDVAPSEAPEWEDPSALEALLHELRAGEGGAVVAHRRGQRFVQGHEPLTLPAVERPSLLRERGVYLITGGLGGVTFVLAAYLAHVTRARLVLTGRARLPERSEWTTWRQTHGDLDPVVQRLVRIEALENAGAEVLPISADVGSLEDMRRAVARAEERFGEINGVVHGAGIVGGATFRPLAQIGPTECEEQFYPKVKGLMVLDQALGPRPLDFCILTSSLSSVLGGYAYGAYAAANTFMDAYARSRSGPTPWLSVNWDEWRLSREPEGAGGGLARFAMSAAEGAGAFGRLLELRGVSQVVVSTGDLQSRMDEWVKLESLDRQKTDTGSSRPRHPRPQLQNAYAAPGTPTEKKIAAIWAELLGLEKVGIQDNFFDLGGHSLLGIQVVTRIKSELGAEISVASLFEGPTVESLSRIAGPKAEEDEPSFDRSSERGRRRKEGRLRRRVRRTEGSA